jgi:hypothetical protein
MKNIFSTYRSNKINYIDLMIRAEEEQNEPEEEYTVFEEDIDTLRRHSFNDSIYW